MFKGTYQLINYKSKRNHFLDSVRQIETKNKTKQMKSLSVETDIIAVVIFTKVIGKVPESKSQLQRRISTETPSNFKSPAHCKIETES